jgi:hypothetical protein
VHLILDGPHELIHVHVACRERVNDLINNLSGHGVLASGGSNLAGRRLLSPGQ